MADTGDQETVARRVRVSGRVQGVWYRESCRQEAERLGVYGWAINHPDGSVEVHAEGSRDAVDALIEWSHHGSPHARVQEVHEDPVKPEGCTEFEVV